MNGMDTSAYDAARATVKTEENTDELTSALASLRQGTEILRTGGGTQLTSSQCNALLIYLDKLVEEKFENLYACRRCIDAVRHAGCCCVAPLLGHRPGVGPRCRLCNSEAK